MAANEKVFAMAGYSLIVQPVQMPHWKYFVEDNIRSLIINVKPKLKLNKYLLSIDLPSSPAIANTHVSCTLARPVNDLYNRNLWLICVLVWVKTAVEIHCWLEFLLLAVSRIKNWSWSRKLNLFPTVCNFDLQKFFSEAQLKIYCWSAHCPCTKAE